MKTDIHIDECRMLILKMIEQTVRDFLNLSHSSAPIERWYYETACGFIFDDDYRIDYGGVDKSMQDLLDILDIDIVWFRQRVVRLKDKKLREQAEKRLILNEETEDSIFIGTDGECK